MELNRDRKYFHPLSSILSTFIHVIHFHSLSSNFIHLHPLSSTFIQFHPLSLILYNFYSLSITFTHFYPLSSTFIHFHPLSSTFIHFHPLFELNEKFHLEAAHVSNSGSKSQLLLFQSPVCFLLISQNFLSVQQKCDTKCKEWEEVGEVEATFMI